MSYCIGIDVGGTTSTIAIGNSARRVLHVSEQFASSTAKGPQHTIQAISNQILASLKRVNLSPDQIADIGLSTPGPATFDGVLLNSPNFDRSLWNEFPFRVAIEEKIREKSPQASVHYIGDGQSAAFGEYSIRTGTIEWDRVQSAIADDDQISSLFMVAVGTGLGGGEVRNGRAVRGMLGRAGHAGHIFLPAYAFRYEHDQQLVVGNAKCTVESAVSLTALTHQLGYRLSLDKWRGHKLNDLSCEMREKAKQLRGLAAEGDALAIELFSDQARALGIGLLALNYIGDYDLLVIGGGVCDLKDEVRNQYRETAEKAYTEFALDGFKSHARIEFSVCGDESPVIGALAYAYSHAAKRIQN